MKERVEALLVSVARTVVAVQGFRKRFAASYVEPYCRHIQASSGVRMRRLRAEVLKLGMLSIIMMVHEGLVSPLWGNASTRPTAVTPASRLQRILRSIVFAAIVVCLQFERGVVLFEKQVTSLVLNVLRIQARTGNLRQCALDLILADRSSPIFLVQLLFWLTSRAKSLDWVLGELVEGYERTTNKYGQRAGTAWAYLQLKMHLLALARSITFFVTGLGWLLAWIRRHR